MKPPLAFLIPLLLQTRNWTWAILLCKIVLKCTPIQHLIAQSAIEEKFTPSWIPFKLTTSMAKESMSTICTKKQVHPLFNIPQLFLNDVATSRYSHCKPKISLHQQKIKGIEEIVSKQNWSSHQQL